jgi:hypothetical protein
MFGKSQDSLKTFFSFREFTPSQSYFFHETWQLGKEIFWEKSKIVLKPGIHYTFNYNCKASILKFLKNFNLLILLFLPMNTESASRMCPNIEKMLFIHHPDCCPSLLPIAGCSNKLSNLKKKSKCFLALQADFGVI